MNCWHCSNRLEFNSGTMDTSQIYHCESCDKWYEMKKDKERLNGAVPVRFTELESYPNS